MGYLVAVTVLWAFSFSLIGVYLSGQVDSYFAVLVRLSLAALVFAPLLRPVATGRRAALGLMAVGAVQIGLMYLCFYQSFEFLSVPEVLLFSVLTPIYISVLDDLLAGRFRLRCLAAAVLAVVGATVIRYTEVGENVWLGFALVQGANLCFAIGQVGYRRLVPYLPAGVPLHAQFGWFFIGAWPLAAMLYAVFGDHDALPTTTTQWGVLVWLGLGASGLGYYAWNRGLPKVDAGTLAVMNNALIPAGLTVNLLIWNHDADIPRLAAGSLLMLAALMINRWMAATRPVSLWSRH
ncbi:EamA family transporter [Salinisphaera sp. SPP-AMP-43]|uniref:EamA family transporter n=1 Tax=Salinisphaera sp. SPP-AMP-43 TaxID=3121288 RepID=UPI003C6DE3F6